MIICGDRITLKLWWGYKKGKERHKILIHFIQISLFDSLNLQFPVMTAELLLNFFNMHLIV